MYTARRWRRRAVAAMGFMLFGASAGFVYHCASQDEAREQMVRWVTMQGSQHAR